MAWHRYLFLMYLVVVFSGYVIFAKHVLAAHASEEITTNEHMPNEPGFTKFTPIN